MIWLNEEDERQMQEAIGQFKDVVRDAEKIADELKKTIFIMQHITNGNYKYAENRNDVRKLERQQYEIVDKVNP
jgi:hypothetical protein